VAVALATYIILRVSPKNFRISKAEILAMAQDDIMLNETAPLICGSL